MPVVVILLLVIQFSLNTSAPMAELPPVGQRPMPVLDVETPAVPAEVEAACTALIAELPAELEGMSARRIRSTAPTAFAWGSDPTILRCGVPRPTAYQVGVSTLAISNVEWFFRTAARGTTYTAVDRGIYLEVFVPSSADGGAALAVLGPLIDAVLPYVAPTPG